jgi:hypothetical protein
MTKKAKGKVSGIVAESHPVHLFVISRSSRSALNDRGRYIFGKWASMDPDVPDQ